MLKMVLFESVISACAFVFSLLMKTHVLEDLLRSCLSGLSGSDTGGIRCELLSMLLDRIFYISNFL
jgi:hypothetical protein